MISTIIEALDLAASGKLPTALRHGLAELQPEIGPAVFNGTDWTLIGNDNGTFSYWRLTGPVRERVGESALTCANVFTVTYPMRLVSVVDRSICTDVVSHARAAATAVRGVERELRTVLGANLVEVGAANVLTTGVYRSEFGAEDVLPTGKSIVAIDITVSVTGNATCFDPCEDTKSLLCSLVEAATWAKIKACMSDAQIDAAEADLCDGGGDCPETTVNGVTSDTPAISVRQGGVEVGTLNPATGVHEVPECEPCDPVLDVSLNGGRPFTQIELACGLNTYDIELTREDGTPIGEYDTIHDRLEVRPGKVQLQDTAGNDIGSVVNVEPESTGNIITAPDGVVQLTDDEANVFQTANVRSGQTLQIEVVDSQVEVRNSVPTQLAVVQVGPEGTEIYTVPDSNVQLRDSSNNPIGSPVAVPASTNPSITAPDGSVTIRNSVPTTLHTVAVRSNGSTTQAIADSTITRPDGTTEGLPATVALDVRNYRSGIVYNFGYILASGQTASYRTGDEGSYRTAGFFNYTRPVYPTAYAELSAGTWDTLAANNIHGNTLRFTNRAGGAAATSGNRVIQDHLTGLEWYIPNSMPAATTWNNAIDAAEASTVESSSDWMLPNDRMLDTITRDDTSVPLNLTPFFITTELWTSTTDPLDTTQARRCVNAAGGGLFGRAAKSGNNGSYIFCRKFI